MGTNYYIRYNECRCCNRFSEFHIGKSSMGWSFSFHEIDDMIDSSIDPKEILLGNKEIKITISSFKDLKAFIEKYVVDFRTARIVNEYDDEISAHDFYELVEHKKDGKKHATECPHDSYLDEDGHSFSSGDFS